MARLENARRLIVNADDFGRSHSINQAVIHAHREGILTTGSLMVNEPACDEAVALARENPRLGVGLHLSLLCGRSALTPEKIPGLVNEKAEFGNEPAAVGFRYFSRRSLHEQLRAEIHEQFKRFRATGLVMDHVNGHLHMHLHPTVFRILMEDAKELGIERLRLTRDPFRLNAKLVSGQWLYRGSHAFIYLCLSGRARPHLQKRGIRHTHKVFGLLQNAKVDERYLTKLLPHLPKGDSELYSHPSLDEFRNEYEALISPKVKELVTQLGIQLIRYQDL
ncbi:hopanoid biosynthesis-associated protein HpnK [Pedosphaera parvula]|uniref:Hopanoid biosynthesis associated protein HpnK n=1 Tax=Pedosphaera parvula (strain Ellin514) TaxID=320771 RepID=B9XH09_PEDPL|nr:hopanoid biosynthesis-associated protein HpnK [Pedosphaera parvula]EEF60930.1 hopanoid biosynthesis associated protein HpnK [Pedosphaera parvula Ellin514]